MGLTRPFRDGRGEAAVRAKCVHVESHCAVRQATDSGLVEGYGVGEKALEVALGKLQRSARGRGRGKVRVLCRKELRYKVGPQTPSFFGLPGTAFPVTVRTARPVAHSSILPIYPCPQAAAPVPPPGGGDGTPPGNLLTPPRPLPGSSPHT